MCVLQSIFIVPEVCFFLFLFFFFNDTMIMARETAVVFVQ